MSDLLEAASSALGTPTALVQRSAAARAAANGTTTDDVLSAWAGGGAVAPASQPAPDEPEDTPGAPDEEPSVETRPTPLESTPEPELAPAQAPMPQMVSVIEPEAEPLEPVALGERIRIAVRVGAWTGAGLGLIGFLIAGAFWAPTSLTTDPGGAVVVVVGSMSVLIGLTLVSIVFGAVVASISRAAAAWRDPAMELSSPRTSTAWLGAALGLVLGVGAASLLTGGFGIPIEAEPGLVQLPVVATLAVMLAGGAILGAITAGIPQLLGTPVAVDEKDLDEVAAVRSRLGDAIGVPVAGVVLLAVLVLPFAYALLESNHLIEYGGAVVAIIAAGGILGFAALVGNRPQVKISLGEMMVAVIGIGTVLLILIAVLVFRDGDSGGDHTEPDPESAVVLLI